MRFMRKLRYSIRQIKNGTMKTCSFEEFYKELYKNDPWLKPYIDGEITHDEYCDRCDIIEKRRKIIENCKKRR